MPMHLVTREDKQFEQVVLCELLIPDVPNCFGDVYTKDAIREFCYTYAKTGFEIDINHDHVDVQGQDAIVVESFIARAGDPNFIEGSWVIGMKILSDELWQRVLNGEINGYSYEAEVFFTDMVFQNLRDRQVVGTTEPHPIDGHTHTFLVILDPFNRPVSGATGETNGHSHRILTHTVTAKAISLDSAGEHNHRYQVIKVEGA
jgi:hypothetical protein